MEGELARSKARLPSLLLALLGLGPGECAGGRRRALVPWEPRGRGLAAGWAVGRDADPILPSPCLLPASLQPTPTLPLQPPVLPAGRGIVSGTLAQWSRLNERFRNEAVAERLRIPPAPSPL